MDDDNLFYDIMLWIPKFLFLIVVAFVLMAIINAVHTQDLTSQKVELQLLIESMYNSPDVFAYQDPLTKRVYPGIVDYNQFNDTNFTRIMESQSKRFLVKIDLIKGFHRKLNTKYFTSGRESTKEDFETRLTTKNYKERIGEEIIITKPVEIINHKEGDFEGRLVFYGYIEQ